VRRLRLGDETGQITVVLWNEKVDELGDVTEGDRLQIMNAKVKERLDGELELHGESSAQASILREAFPPSSLLRIEKIGRLTPSMKDVSVLARVVHVGRVREFKRSGGQAGSVATIQIQDDTGSVRVNLWNDKAALAEQIEPGNTILIERAYTRQRFGGVNLNVGGDGDVTPNPAFAEAEKLPPYEEKITKIAEIKEEGGPITVKGTVATVPTLRQIVTKRGEKVELAFFQLEDDTGRVGVSLWRRTAESSKDLTVGASVKIKNAYVRRGFGDQWELTSGALTTIQALPKPDSISA